MAIAGGPLAGRWSPCWPSGRANVTPNCSDLSPDDAVHPTKLRGSDPPCRLNAPEIPSGRRALTEQGYPRTQPDYPGRRGRSEIPQEPRRSGWQVLDAFDAGGDSEADPPPW